MPESSLAEQIRNAVRSFRGTPLRSRLLSEAKGKLDREEQAVSGKLAQVREKARRLEDEIHTALAQKERLLATSGRSEVLKRTSAVPGDERRPADGDLEGATQRFRDADATLLRLLVDAEGALDLPPGIGIFLISSVLLGLLAIAVGVALHSAVLSVLGAVTGVAIGAASAREVRRWDLESWRASWRAFAQAAADVEQACGAHLFQSEQALGLQRGEARTRYEETVRQINDAYRRAVARWRSLAAQAQEGAEVLSPAWDDSVWHGCPLPAGGAFLTRLGVLRAAVEGETLVLPAILEFPGQRSLLTKGLGSANADGAGLVRSICLRMLASMPAGKARLVLVDPIGLGQNVAAFMHLADYDEALVTSKAWTEPRHIEQRLADLTEHMENVIQKYLRNEFTTIEEYNAQAGEVAEPYRVLVVLDFPVNFSEEAARRLVSIVQNGPRCGVHTIVLVDTEKPLPHGFALDDLERASTVIVWNKDRWVWEDDDFRDCALELDAPPGPDLFNRIVQTVGEAARAASHVEVPFERIAPSRAAWWTEAALSGIRVPLGPSGAQKLQQLDLGKGTAQHVLVAGKTGSGKSTLLHTLITSLSLRYSPDEVELYLVDFKKGVEFKTYATHRLPHARVVAIESEREFGLSVLQGLDAELKRRGDLFRGAGVDGLPEYRQRIGQRMPRVLLLVDEFQEFFTEDDQVASQSTQILDRLVRQGRAFGIHVLLGSQTLAGAYTLARSTIDQMAVRIALQCSEADSRLILADDNPVARLLSRPGEAIYNAANGMVEGNNRFQVAWLSDEKRDQYLEQITAKADEQQFMPPRPQIVFEGNAPADVEKNGLLADLIGRAEWPVPTRSYLAWLGEPIAIRDPVAAIFRCQSGSNLLIAGQNDEAAFAIMLVALASLAAQSPPRPGLDSVTDGPRFYVLDFGAVDVPYADLFGRLASALPHGVEVGRRRQLPQIIEKLAFEVQRRLDLDETPVLLTGTPSSAAPVFLFIHGLQRARDLRQEDGFGGPSFSFGEEPAPPDPAQQFITILRDGPEVGVHTIVFCDTVTNLSRAVDRRTLREFTLRVAFQMSAEDSSNLIDTPAASRLGQHRALFFSEDEGKLEKFRPYGMPSQAWLSWVGRQLQSRRSLVT